MSAREIAVWKGDLLMIGRKPTGYEVVPDQKYPGVMWRVQRPDGSLSEMVNRTRAKDAAYDMLDRDMRSSLGDTPDAPMRWIGHPARVT